MQTPYFIIGNNELYIDSVLVECNDDPIFFICKSKNKYYIAVCIDVDSMCFYVCETFVDELIQMFNKSITMRKMFLGKTDLIEIKLGKCSAEDSVKPISEPDEALLPKEDAYYRILANDIKDYYEKLLDIQRSKEYKIIFEATHDGSWSIVYENAFSIKDALKTIVPNCEFLPLGA